MGQRSVARMPATSVAGDANTLLAQAQEIFGIRLDVASASGLTRPAA